MESKTKRKGIWVGGAVVALSAVVYFFRSPSGKKTVDYAKECKDKVIDGYNLVKENRNEIMEHIKITSEQITHNVRSVKEDIKTITDCAKDIKVSTNELVQVATDSIETLKKVNGQKK